MSILQVVTQVQESSLTFVPKLIAAAAVLLLLDGWMMTTLAQFATRLISNIPSYFQPPMSIRFELQLLHSSQQEQHNSNQTLTRRFRYPTPGHNARVFFALTPLDAVRHAMVNIWPRGG